MAEPKRCVITLTTDLGAEDGNVGVMKGVICGINPYASIVDLTHQIPPQDVRDAAYVLRRTYAYFPAGTIHVLVVDPGVGSERRAIAVQAPDAFLVAPDNGCLTYVLQELRDKQARLHIVHLTNPQYWLPNVSRVFHGRDIFAPVAAHLSLGVDMRALGEPITDPLMLPPLRLDRRPYSLLGQVAHIDHFGNLLTNIPESDLVSLGEGLTIKVGDTEITALSSTFAHGQPGQPIAYIDSSGHLGIAVVNGNAQRSLDIHAGQSVEIRRSDPTSSRRRHRD